MVLTKKLFVFFIYLQCICFAYCNSDYWNYFIKESMNNNPKVQEIRKDYISAYINKKQNDYLWLPYFQLDFSQNIEETRGDYLYIQNQSPSPETMWLLIPNTIFSINQKLPGYGNLSLSGIYGISYLINRNSFLQQPSLQIQYTQNLGQGAFGITKNAERYLLNEQYSYSHLIFQKKLLEELQTIIGQLKTFDILSSEEKYYNALLIQYQTEFNTAQEKHSKGLQSNLETYFAQHQVTNSKNQLDEIKKQKEEILKELILFFPEFNEEDFQRNKNEFLKIINTLFEQSSECLLKFGNNIEANLYTNMLNQHKYNYQLQELQFVPTFYATASLGPNNNIYSVYADWYKSFRNLFSNPYPINFNCNIGIKMNFETITAKKLRKNIYDLERQNLDFYRITNIQNESKQIEILNSQLLSYKDYNEKLGNEIIQEETYRTKRKELFSQNLITQNDFFQSETLFFLIMRDYSKNFWDIVTTQVQLVCLTSNYNLLLTYFLGENYEKIY